MRGDFMVLRLYGIRGATTVKENESQEILKETGRLLETIMQENRLLEENVVSIIFTTTPDLNAEFPAKAARQLGLNNTPLLGTVEADVPHGLPKCIRILIHAYLETGSEIKHVYLNEAVNLRPDMVQKTLSW